MFCVIEGVMDDEGSPHLKSNGVCITEDAESIDLGWLENTKLNRVDACRKWASVIGSHLAHLREEFERVW